MGMEPCGKMKPAEKYNRKIWEFGVRSWNLQTAKQAKTAKAERQKLDEDRMNKMDRMEYVRSANTEI